MYAAMQIIKLALAQLANIYISQLIFSKGSFQLIFAIPLRFLPTTLMKLCAS